MKKKKIAMEIERENQLKKLRKFSKQFSGPTWLLFKLLICQTISLLFVLIFSSNT